MRLKVLERCLLSGQPALSTYPATQSVQVCPREPHLSYLLSRGSVKSVLSLIIPNCLHTRRFWTPG
jgi:hypothetical protein